MNRTISIVLALAARGADNGESCRGDRFVVKKNRVHKLKVLSILTLVLIGSFQAFGLGADHPADKPIHLANAPARVNALINTTNRVHGFFVNAEDRFFYAGDTAAFESFLKHYAALEDIAGHRMIVHPDRIVAKSPWSDGEGAPCDWMLEVAAVSWREHGAHHNVYRDQGGLRPKEGESEYLVELHLPKKSDIDISKINIPKGILVVNEETKP